MMVYKCLVKEWRNGENGCRVNFNILNSHTLFQLQLAEVKRLNQSVYIVYNNYTLLHIAIQLPFAFRIDYILNTIITLSALPQDK